MTASSDLVARKDLRAIFYARALEKMRLMLIAVHDGLEDEGDRVYLGSSNHADDIRAAWQEADALKWDEILSDTQPQTELAATNLSLQARILALEADNAALVEALKEARKGLDTAQLWSDSDWVGYEIVSKANVVVRATLAKYGGSHD